MVTAEGRAWHAISRAPGIGQRTLWSIAEYLMEHHRTASWLLQQRGAMEIALRGRSTRVDTSTIHELVEAGDDRVTVLHPLHPGFPERVRGFRESFPLPAVLYTRGNAALINEAGVAVVGARHAAGAALEAAEGLAAELAGSGINVISGYARGIDTAAHCGALRGGGTTSIVLCEGINQFRPKRELREFFSKENTLVISQFKPGARWAAHCAMTRNKLVCALAHAVVVIESGPERDAGGRMSGTYDAGTTAIGMGVPVFAVTPGFFTEEPEGNRQLLSKGCREWNPSDGAEPIISAFRGNAAAAPGKPEGEGGKKGRSVQPELLGYEE